MKSPGRAAIAFVVVAAVAGGACSDDDSEEGAGRAADEQRYCELTADVEAQAEEAFSALGEDASEEEAAEVRGALLEDLDDELDEMVRVAPAEISDDVEAFVEFFRAEMRGEEDVEQVSDERILAWEEEHCPDGSG